MFEFSIKEHMIKKRKMACGNAKAKAAHSCLTKVAKELIISVSQSRVIISLNVPKYSYVL